MAIRCRSARAVSFGTARGSKRGVLFLPDRRLKIIELISRPPAETRAEWLAEFEAAARRPLATRLRYAFIHTYKPVLDDEPYRSFETMSEYRAWCAENLPAWLGYGPAV